MRDHDKRLVEQSRPISGSYGCGAMLTETEIAVMVRIKATSYATIQAFEDVPESMAYIIAIDCLADYLVKVRSGELPDRTLDRGPDIEHEREEP